eukprot:197715_1
MKALKPILKHEDVINGVMPIEITNIDEFNDIYYDNGQRLYKLNFSYMFKLQNNHQYYANNYTWKSTGFILCSLNRMNQFAIKLPLFLLSYSLEFNLSINANDIVLTSENYAANIPSILLESTYQINDHVQFHAPNSGWSRFGTIMKLLPDNMITIKTDPHYRLLNFEAVICDVHSSQVFRPPVRSQHLINITNRNRAEMELILGTNDETKFAFYVALKNTLFNTYVDEMNTIEKSFHQFEYMCIFVATNIYRFVYCVDYNYRIDCMLDSGHLFHDNAWLDNVKRNFGLQMKDKHSYNVRECDLSRSVMGYSCDICRIEINWYDFVFSCRGDDDHAFCMSCIHSILMQYNEIKPFIYELLKDILDDNCVEVIVAFCVGKIVKNNNKQLSNKKRKLNVNNERTDDNQLPNKKRKLNNSIE